MSGFLRFAAGIVAVGLLILTWMVMQGIGEAFGAAAERMIP